MQNARFYCTLLLIGIGALLVSLKHTHVSTIEKSSFADIPTRSLEAAHKNGKKPKRSGNTRPHSTKKSTKEIKISKDSMHTNATVPTSLFDSCGNSALWLKGPRHGNSDDDKYLSPNIVQSMILNLENSLVKKNVALPVLEQTICHKNSRLMNMSQPSELQNDEKAVRLWAVKLIYLAIHYHQHRHAIHEAKRRHGSKKSHCSRAMKDHKVGIFDYECPNAKYIVMPLGGNGLGANVRGGMVVALLMGLMSDRVVLFVNGARKGHRSIKKPWSLASCSRQDYQCFFWAPTPCSLTEDDLLMAYTLTHGEYLRITKKQSQLKSIQHHKVWVFNSAFLPVTGLPRRAGETLYKHAQTLISAVSQEENPPYYELLQRAAESIKETDKPREGYNYAAAGTKVQHALSMYAMRPNPRYAHELDEILADIIPRSFHPENSIGLPIRGKIF